MLNLTISIALLLTLASSSYGGVTRDSSGFSAFGYSAPDDTFQSASAGVSAFGFSASATPSRSATVGGSAFGFSASATPSRSDTVGSSAFGFSASASTLSPAFKEQLTALYDLAVIMEDKSEIFLRRIDA